MAALLITSVILNLVFIFFSICNLRRCRREKAFSEEKGKRIASDTLNPQVTNHGLLEICTGHLNGKWCEWWEKGLSLDTILKIALQCKEYLCPLEPELLRLKYLQKDRRANVLTLGRALTMRQIRCGIYAGQLIGKQEYMHAMHEFMDCIDDYGNARRESRPVSMNEYALYSYLLELFLSAKNEQLREEATYGEI